MPAFAPSDLAAWSQGTWSHLPAVVPKGLSVDTRTLQPGEIFVALRTARRDGHQYLAEARTRGAAAAIVSTQQPDELPQLVVGDTNVALRHIAAEWRQRFVGKVVGVTGSVGKTSTKELLGAMLGSSAFVTEANLNNLLGVPLMLLRVEPAQHRTAVIEAGMSVLGELALSAQVIHPDLAIVTAVESVHLEGVGSLAAVAQEKSQLVAALKPTGWAIIPAKLLEWPEFAAHATRTIAVQFADEPAPAVKPGRLVQAAILRDVEGRQSLSLDGKVYPCGELSQGLMRNAALALTAALELEVAPEALAQVLVTWMPPAGRGSVHRIGKTTYYVDCYNASPASLLDSAACFDRLSRLDPRPRLFLLGGMAELGKLSCHLHHECGVRLPVRAGDLVIAYGGDAAAYLPGLPQGVQSHVAATLEQVQADLFAHRGFIFVKGSRSHALERALPPFIRDTLNFH
jgi:UDP-N-acetylmuramoyl-tripeptide--D-alanyl-D-alanine ligase